MSEPEPQAERAGKAGNFPPPEHRWPKGRSGNPGGQPKGFVPLSRAYAVIAKLELSEVEQIAEGKKPPRWGKRPLRMPYVAAAKMWLAGTPPAAAEIADRTEGKVPQSHDVSVAGLSELAIALREAVRLATERRQGE